MGSGVGEVTETTVPTVLKTPPKASVKKKAIKESKATEAKRATPPKEKVKSNASARDRAVNRVLIDNPKLLIKMNLMRKTDCCIA